MKPIGRLLNETDVHDSGAAASVFLRSFGGEAVSLLPRSSAEALLQHVASNPAVTVTGDITRGFAWPVPGAHPRRSYVVIPLHAPVWPHTPHPAAVTVELWWPPDHHGRRLIRSFVAWANDPFNAYLIACCLWSTKAAGDGAEAAYLYGPDRSIAFRINDAARTCSSVPAETVAQAVATAEDRFSTDSLPDARTSAMQEERIEGIWTYTGTREEITACLKEHANGREASMDAPGAYAMREAAKQIEGGKRTEFRSKTQARYRVVGAADNIEAGAVR